MSARPRPSLLAASIAAAFLSLPAGAQTAPSAADPGKTPLLAPVAVTAKGYAAQDVDTPVAQTVLTREDLQRKQAANLGDALRGEPGLSVASDGAHGGNPVIRGLKKESLVLLVDGVRLNSAQPQGAIASFMSLALADRVEVVKGPASVLYGSGALGGVIQVRLPQARLDPGSTISLAGGLDSGSSGLRGSVVLNRSQGDHALMLGLALADVDDYEAPAGTVALSGYDSAALIGQYRLRIDREQQLRVSLQQQLDEDVWYPGSRKPHANAALVGQTIVHSPLQRRRLFELGWSRQDAGDAPLNLDLRVYRQEVERRIHSYSDKLQRDIGQTLVGFVTDGVDARADWLLDAGHQLSAGFNGWTMRASPQRWLASPTPMSPLQRNDPFADGELRSLGLFLQDDVRFGRLGLLAGLRHDRVSGDAASLNNGAVTSGLRRSDGASTGSLGLSFDAAPLLRPYASLARAFRAGEMRERFESSPRGDGYFYVGNPQIRPEYATQFELGLKGSDGALQYNLAVYRNRITDYITGQPTGSTQAGLPVKRTVNLGEVTISGVEAGLRWQWRQGQTLSAAFSRLRGTNEDLDEPLFQMPADEVSLGWEGRVGAGWSADATLRLVARQDRVATEFARGTENATAGFGTLDLGATWQLAKGQSLRLALRNLADKAYHEHLTEGVSGAEIQAPGRSLQLSWQGRF
jgi:hemoglobin/transferrin/lactoferrin receptor protein